MAAGTDAHGALQSTEILVGSSAAWTVTTNLPKAMYANRAVTVNNVVYHTGQVVVWYGV